MAEEKQKKKHKKITADTGSQSVQNTKQSDSTSKIIFQEPVLMAQFLRDYSNIPLLKDVKPEDIEDVSERFVHLFAEERESDTVKRVHLKNNIPFFIVSLIEHKTSVDYNVTMQILRYMVFIWEDYEKECKRLHQKDKSVLTASSKGFRYPLILPIVYYEGTDRWTAARQLKERICFAEELKEYIPNFSYELIQLNGYSNEELLAHQNEISLIMMFNKVQNLQDMENLKKLLPEDIESITKDTPEYLLTVISEVIRAFLSRINLPIKETEEVIDKVRRNKNMGVLFENMEKLDIQLERRLRREAEENLAKAIANAEEKSAKEVARAEAKTISLLLPFCQANGMSITEISQKLMDELHLSKEELDALLPKDTAQS